jgi:hypothetical protein
MKNWQKLNFPILLSEFPIIAWLKNAISKVLHSHKCSASCLSLPIDKFYSFSQCPHLAITLNVANLRGDYFSLHSSEICNTLCRYLIIQLIF